MKKSVLVAAVGTAIAGSALAAGPMDFGQRVEKLLKDESVKHFGVVKPLATSAVGDVVRQPGDTAWNTIKLAPGLKATFLTRNIADKADMFAFWPNDATPSHLVFCIEGDREDLGVALPGAGVNKFNPSVQRVDVNTGAVETMLRGMSACDGIRRTAWGTIVATEETDDGGVYEIIDPLNTINHTVTDRALGTVIDNAGNPASNVAKRVALPVIAWEGLELTGEGVVIAGDEERPGSGSPDQDGGAIFKFLPAVPHAGGVITELADSPLVAGSSYAMQVSCVDDKQQMGQGCEIGNAAWVPVTAANARVDAHTNGATGYYRPEDLHFDPAYTGPGVRFCWANTGNEGASNYAEVVCGVDSDPMLADSDTRSVVVNRFVEGDTQANSFDNLAFQPSSGNLYVIEDHDNGDVWACLPDGGDRDLKSDGCVRVLSVKDQEAEPTGFAFTADGKSAYLSIQHSDDAAMPNVDDYATDDIIVITGFKK